MRNVLQYNINNCYVVAFILFLDESTAKNGIPGSRREANQGKVGNNASPFLINLQVTLSAY